MGQRSAIREQSWGTSDPKAALRPMTSAGRLSYNELARTLAKGVTMSTRRGKDWQLSLQRMVTVSREALWRALQEGPAPLEGHPFTLRDGIEGVIHEVESPRWLRLGVKERGGSASTIEIELAPRGNTRTALRLHHHGLPSQEAREAFRQRWSDGLARLASSVEG